jgi:hypothetical protein
MIMKRIFSDFLVSWLASERRKPLIVRGARQVGKTWLVRELARSSRRMLLEVNFDRNPEYARIFREEGSGPRRWLDDLALRTGVEARSGGGFGGERIDPAAHIANWSSPDLDDKD